MAQNISQLESIYGDFGYLAHRANRLYGDKKIFIFIMPLYSLAIVFVGIGLMLLPPYLYGFDKLDQVHIVGTLQLSIMLVSIVTVSILCSITSFYLFFLVTPRDYFNGMFHTKFGYLRIKEVSHIWEKIMAKLLMGLIQKEKEFLQKNPDQYQEFDYLKF